MICKNVLCFLADADEASLKGIDMAVKRGWV